MINKRIIRVIFMFTLMFIMLIGYMTYFEIFQSEAVHQNPYNKRQWAYEEDITRGSILTGAELSLPTPRAPKGYIATDPYTAML